MPVELSRLMRDGTLRALEDLTQRIEVVNRLLRVQTASQIGTLLSVLHLLDLVLVEVWIVNVHAERLN